MPKSVWTYCFLYSCIRCKSFYHDDYHGSGVAVVVGGRGCRGGGWAGKGVRGGE